MNKAQTTERPLSKEEIPNELEKIQAQLDQINTSEVKIKTYEDLDTIITTQLDLVLDYIFLTQVQENALSGELADAIDKALNLVRVGATVAVSFSVGLWMEAASKDRLKLDEFIARMEIGVLFAYDARRLGTGHISEDEKNVIRFYRDQKFSIRKLGRIFRRAENSILRYV